MHCHGNKTSSCRFLLFLRPHFCFLRRREKLLSLITSSQARALQVKQGQQGSAGSKAPPIDGAAKKGEIRDAKIMDEESELHYHLNLKTCQLWPRVLSN